MVHPPWARGSGLAGRVKQLIPTRRTAILAEEEIVASKRRFGLFSQPPPIAVGDNSLFPPKSVKKGENGKPITQPRNMLAGPNRSGITKRSFIQVPDSIYQKDPYTNSFQQDLQYERKMHSKSQMHEADFTPASGFKTIANAAYPYVEEKAPAQKKPQRDENGRVKTQPAHVQASPTSKVEYTLFKHPGYQTDPYDRPAQIHKQDMAVWKEKFKHEAMFKTMSHGGAVFGKDKAVYGLDAEAETLMKSKPTQSIGNYNRVKHQAKFKLARRGFGDPIGRYPVYVAPRVATEPSESNTKGQKQGSDKEDWKPSAGGLSRPTPSISLMLTNMRRCM